LSDFSFSEEHELLRMSVRDLAKNAIAPGLRERQKTHEFPVGLKKEMASAGLFGLNVAEQDGGYPLDTVSFGIAIEELGKVDTSAIWYCFNSWVQSGFVGLGSQELKEEWLPAIAEGEKLIGMGSTEAEAGSDLANLKTSVRKDGKYYILNGEKNSVSHGTEVDARPA
jgi:alkylation response protein AidB-like acyl-CoA dehydrogenase